MSEGKDQRSSTAEERMKPYTHSFAFGFGQKVFVIQGEQERVVEKCAFCEGARGFYVMVGNPKPKKEWFACSRCDGRGDKVTFSAMMARAWLYYLALVGLWWGWG